MRRGGALRHHLEYEREGLLQADAAAPPTAAAIDHVIAP